MKITWWGVLPALVLLIVLITFFGGTNACRFAIAVEPARDQYGSWCFEFWLNRYQGLLGALATLGGGYLAYRAVLRQTRAAREGVLITVLASLRQLAIDVQETRWLAFGVANIRGISLRVANAENADQLAKVLDEYVERWKDHRRRTSLIVRSFFGFVPSIRLAKALSEWSIAANILDNFGLHWTQVGAESAAFADFQERKDYLSGQIAARAQDGDEHGSKLERLRQHLVDELARQIQLMEAELVRIAPPLE